MFLSLLSRIKFVHDLCIVICAYYCLKLNTYLNLFTRRVQKSYDLSLPNLTPRTPSIRF